MTQSNTKRERLKHVFESHFVSAMLCAVFFVCWQVGALDKINNDVAVFSVVLAVSLAFEIGRALSKSSDKIEDAAEKAAKADRRAEEATEALARMSTSFTELRDAHEELAATVANSYEAPLRAQELLRAARVQCSDDRHKKWVSVSAKSLPDAQACRHIPDLLEQRGWTVTPVQTDGGWDFVSPTTVRERVSYYLLTIEQHPTPVDEPDVLRPGVVLEQLQLGAAVAKLAGVSVQEVIAVTREIPGVGRGMGAYLTFSPSSLPYLLEQAGDLTRLVAEVPEPRDAYELGEKVLVRLSDKQPHRFRIGRIAAGPSCSINDFEHTVAGQPTNRAYRIQILGDTGETWHPEATLTLYEARRPVHHRSQELTA